MREGEDSVGKSGKQQKKESVQFFFFSSTLRTTRERESVLPFFSLFFLVFATTLLFSLHASVRVSSRSK